MDLEEKGGVDPVVERTCSECGVPLTEQEIQAVLDSGAPYLCTTHATEQVSLEEEETEPEA